MNDAMWEHPATRRERRAAAQRGARSCAPETGALASKGEYGAGRLAEPADDPRRCRIALGCCRGLRPALARRAARARHRRRHARADRLGPLRRQPLVGPDGLGARRRGGAPRRGRDGGRGERVARRAPTASTTSTSRPPPSCDAAAGAAFADADVLLMAAAVADFRADRRGRRQDQEGRPRRAVARACSRRPTCSPRSPAERRGGQVLVGFAAEHGDGGVERARGKLERKGLDAVVVNDISRPGDRLRHARQRGHVRDRRRRAAACRAAPRRRWPRRSSTCRGAARGRQRRRTV